MVSRKATNPMAQRKPAAPAKRLVWRITEAAPLGEFVDPSITPAKSRHALSPEEAQERSRGGWVVSTFELLNGTDISEGPDTVPADLFDELFPPPTPPQAPKKTADGN
jgi:hypothetical protein